MTTVEITRARSLRRVETDAERMPWLKLRDRRLAGHGVVRQRPIDRYVDFACREVRLVVEVDGWQHADNPRDIVRDAALDANNYAVLRFWNREVLTAVDDVRETILAAIEGRFDPFKRYTRPSSALSGTFSSHPERRAAPPANEPCAACVSRSETEAMT